jgi:hypothetical protein
MGYVLSALATKFTTKTPKDANVQQENSNQESDVLIHVKMTNCLIPKTFVTAVQSMKLFQTVNVSAETVTQGTTQLASVNSDAPGPINLCTKEDAHPAH